MKKDGSYEIIILHKRSLDSSVGIVTSFGLKDRSSVSGRSKRFFSTPQRPDLLWDPTSLVSNRYRGPLPHG
jgi:hypothetical protein